MAGLVYTYENKLLDALLGVTPLSMPSTVYVALFTVAPTGNGSVSNELSGNGYARVSLDTLFSAATGTAGDSANTGQISFSAASANWPEVLGVGVMESGVAGTTDMILHGALVAGITVASGESFVFQVGDLVLSLD